MGLEFDFPWALLLLPVAILLVLWIDKRFRRRERSLKSRVTLIVRLFVTTLLALAVAAPSVLLPTGKSATWILLDVSDSTSYTRAAFEQHIADALESAPKDEQVGVIAFGANAMVETPLREQAGFSGVHTAVNPSASDLSGALRLAGALLPAENAGHIVVVSDGQVGDVKAQASALSARGIGVDTLAMPSESLPDAQVTEVQTPSQVFQGQKFSIEVTVDSNFDTTGTLVLYQNNTPTATREVTLRKGENLFAFQDVSGKTGVVTYEAKLLAKGDGQSHNNSASAYLSATGAPGVLLVEGVPGGGEEMAKMLAAAGMRVERVLPDELPVQADALRQYEAIVLANVDADSAEEAQWTAIETAVRTLGRGLCVLGGDSSYALGGYRGSLLETMLPVTIDVRNKLQMPALGLMLVIDKSGSMTSGQFGTTRLEVAKEAAMRSTEVLTAKDQIGVIAFDDAAKWVVPLQEVKDVGAIQSMIGTIRPGGGTSYYSALNEACNALIATNTPQKHIIFLSDGEPGDSGFERLLVNANARGITVTTVAVGGGANTRLMELLATVGGGRAYTAGEFDNIPKIFTKETYLAGGSYVQNRVFTPVVTESSALTDYTGFPQLGGYLTATEKPLATVSLVSDQEDPILAWWPYGAGTVLAWTSDAEGAWTQEFLMWESAASFFGGLVTKTLPRDARDGQLEVDNQNGVAKVRYTLSPETKPEEGLATQAKILQPDGTELTVPLTEIAAGAYEGSFGAENQGAYALRVEQQKEGDTLRVREGGTVVSFPEEYDIRKQAQGGALEQLARETGGQVLSYDDPLLSARNQRVGERKQLTTLLCVLSMLAFLLDIALRRLSWELAVTKWLGLKEKQGKEAREARQTETATAQTRKKSKAQTPSKPSAADTADKLLEAKRERKHL